MKYKQGNLIEAGKCGEIDVLVHGCNCFHTMGAGIASQIARHFPKARVIDRTATTKGDRGKLGTFTSVVEPTAYGNLVVVNAYTQYTYWDPKDMLEYNAIRDVFRSLAQYYAGMRFGIPKIGAGLARGDWPRIEEIINRMMHNQDVTCYVM